METKELARQLDRLLRVDEIPDDSMNGLQVENSGLVETVALGVDASLATFQKAAEAGADLLIVHHGLFWSKPMLICGSMYNRIRTLMDQDIALYAAHLPLDMHPRFGNNARILRLLGWKESGDFGTYHGLVIGKEVHFPKPKHADGIVGELKSALHCDPLFWNFGPSKVSRIGIVSGGGLSMLQEAIDKGLDMFVTGEPGHSSYWAAQEAGIHAVFCGHYATETLGVRALGEWISSKFKLKTMFLDLPTGL